MKLTRCAICGIDEVDHLEGAVEWRLGRKDGRCCGRCDSYSGCSKCEVHGSSPVPRHAYCYIERKSPASDTEEVKE